LKRILTLRKDLKLIITSATADTEAITNFFTIRRDYKSDGESLMVKTVNITGRLHEVFVHYLRQPTRNYFLKIFQTIVYIDREKAPGHVLVFLTSVE
jgi:HrpA-like RNA helicase